MRLGEEECCLKIVMSILQFIMYSEYMGEREPGEARGRKRR